MLNKQQLKKLPTHRLLSLYRRNFKEMKSVYVDMTHDFMPGEVLNNEVRYCIELDKYCDIMKSILNKREQGN